MQGNNAKKSVYHTDREIIYKIEDFEETLPENEAEM